MTFIKGAIVRIEELDSLAKNRDAFLSQESAEERASLESVSLNLSSNAKDIANKNKSSTIVILDDFCSTFTSMAPCNLLLERELESRAAKLLNVALYTTNRLAGVAQGTCSLVETVEKLTSAFNAKFPTLASLIAARGSSDIGGYTVYLRWLIYGRDEGEKVKEYILHNADKATGAMMRWARAWVDKKFGNNGTMSDNIVCFYSGQVHTHNRTGSIRWEEEDTAWHLLIAGLAELFNSVSGKVGSGFKWASKIVLNEDDLTILADSICDLGTTTDVIEGLVADLSRSMIDDVGANQASMGATGLKGQRDFRAGRLIPLGPTTKIEAIISSLIDSKPGSGAPTYPLNHLKT